MAVWDYDIDWQADTTLMNVAAPQHQPKGPTMITISDEDRAEAQAMAEVYLGRGDRGDLSDSGVLWWLAVRDHVLAAHECPTVPAWRPTTAKEIQPGWMIRTHDEDGVESNWGVAHHRDRDGDWLTESGVLLTHAAIGWTYETTAPTPEPEPWPEELVAVVVEWSNEPACSTRDEAARELLTRLDAFKKKGGQS